MGCAQSQPTTASPVASIIDESKEVADVFKAGYKSADEKFAGHFFTDYRGVPSSTALVTSKEKSDNVCSWADKVLAVREITGDFFDPQDPSSWPAEVQEYCRREV